MILPEERVLQSQNPIPDDLNNWPEFTLTDAKVRVPGSATYTSLLEARVGNPLSVTGRLSRLDKQREKLVIHPKYTQVQVKIEACTQFAFGQDPSGKSILWAAGESGWFEIKPSTRYAPVYDEISKAIDLIYFLSDTHQEFASGRPVRGAKVEELLVSYQQHTDYRIDNNAEAEAVLERYHSFLIRQMLAGWEGINWARTHLWSYFSRLYPDEVAQGPTAGYGEADEAQDHEDASDDDSSTVNVSSSNGRDGRGDRDWTDVVFDDIMHIKASGHMCKRHCSVDGLAKVLVKQHDVSSKDEASKIINNVAEKLLARLDADPNQGPNQSWSGKFICQQLQRLVDDGQDSPEDERKDAVLTPAKVPPNRHHRKSILRPSSTGARKGKKRVPDNLGTSDEDDDDDDDDDIHENSKLRPATTDTPSKKRRLGPTTSGPGIAPELMNGDTAQAHSDALPSNLQQEQLHLIRSESQANGRLNVNHLEALIEGLVHVR